jgi:hypothetical protein
MACSKCFFFFFVCYIYKCVVSISKIVFAICRMMKEIRELRENCLRLTKLDKRICQKRLISSPLSLEIVMEQALVWSETNVNNRH